MPTRSSIALARALLLFAGAVHNSAHAQTPDPHAVQPERPTVATHAYTVAPGWLELEFGSQRESRDGQFQVADVPITIKLGLARRLQLNVSTSPAHAAASNGVQIDDATIGLKWRLVNASPILGAFAVLPSVSAPTGSGDSPRAVGVLLISSRKIGQVAVDLNIGYTHRNGDGSEAPNNETIWTVSTGGPFSNRFGWVFEVFGAPRTSGPSGQASTVAALLGPTFTVRPWLTFDVGGIVPISGPQPSSLYAGGVWNIGRLWRLEP